MKLKTRKAALKRVNPKKRGLFSKEVSKLIYDISFNNTDYLTNVVINVNGGKFSRM